MSIVTAKGGDKCFEVRVVTALGGTGSCSEVTYYEALRVSELVALKCDKIICRDNGEAQRRKRTTFMEQWPGCWP
jgi:hypothetical protein